jgi:hypothetical protein
MPCTHCPKRFAPSARRADFPAAQRVIFRAVMARDAFLQEINAVRKLMQAPAVVPTGDPAMFRRLALIGFVLLMAVTVRPASGDARMQAIMRTKLSNTQALLKGIVTTDYKEIDRAAAGLARISEMEIVSWQNPPKREYAQQAMLFMTSVDDLKEASAHRDIEGVGAAYSTLITTCVHCHAYVRDARSASLSLAAPSTN